MGTPLSTKPYGIRGVVHRVAPTACLGSSPSSPGSYPLEGRVSILMERDAAALSGPGPLRPRALPLYLSLAYRRILAQRRSQQRRAHGASFHLACCSVRGLAAFDQLHGLAIVLNAGGEHLGHRLGVDD